MSICMRSRCQVGRLSARRVSRSKARSLIGVDGAYTSNRKLRHESTLFGFYKTSSIPNLAPSLIAFCNQASSWRSATAHLQDLLNLKQFPISEARGGTNRTKFDAVDLFTISKIPCKVAIGYSRDGLTAVGCSQGHSVNMATAATRLANHRCVNTPV